MTDSAERRSIPRRRKVTRVRGETDSKSLNMSLDSYATQGKRSTTTSIIASSAAMLSEARIVSFCPCAFICLSVFVCFRVKKLKNRN